MTKAKALISKLAAGTAFFLSAILFVGANTASSSIIHQPKAPEALRRYSKIK
ncbi:cyclic lactone autoinducer peptide [Acutalibacter sp. 1XD8-36]|uniref:cyclic lactone autoinducer peptide n=1 Tax=Acutalibacter sp. 1XD8-36 TaxID=2320852 RepID=UPI001411F0B5|nr:cyclic lactone autoinducer peptide [Acutalibacter sp. 1XD8-36]NBJ90796.1 cyclic lactone autoinducer peptide [Acutalibacter sp. 1XD8-36]